MTTDLTQTAIRENAARRLRAALLFLETERAAALLSAPAITAWCAEATRQQQRPKMLRRVIACRAARVYSGPAMRQCGVPLESAHHWDKQIYARECASPAFRAEIAAAVAAARIRIEKPRSQDGLAAALLAAQSAKGARR